MTCFDIDTIETANCGTAGFEWLLVAFGWEMFENLKREIRWNKQINRNKSLWDALKLSRLLVATGQDGRVTHSEIVRHSETSAICLFQICYGMLRT